MGGAVAGGVAVVAGVSGEGKGGGEDALELVHPDSVGEALGVTFCFCSGEESELSSRISR